MTDNPKPQQNTVIHTYEVKQVIKYVVVHSSTASTPYMMQAKFDHTICECNTEAEALRLAELLAGAGYVPT